ncbi:DUF1707 and DUF4870 domain-containing protein [Marinactinospora rubrisoli]|uniref:DUF1707 and DUF4870 domain-containing protein n=1 Tax=Marinactinospora rubrisoli TaxID=2715399 RepID=A0ABW2K9X2_9ACTN
MAVVDRTPPPWVPGDPRRRDFAQPAPAQLRVTHADRDAVADRLKEAYADGQLDHDEFEERLDLAMGAKVRGELEPLLADLAPQRPAGGTPASPFAARAPEAEPDREERLWALGGHLSGYFTLALGPLLVLVLKGNGSPYVRRQAMEALNYQLNFLIASVLVPLVAILTLGLGLVVYLFMALGWVVLPGIAALGSALGFSWRYPLTWRIVKDRTDGAAGAGR